MKNNTEEAAAVPVTEIINSEESSNPKKIKLGESCDHNYIVSTEEPSEHNKINLEESKNLKNGKYVQLNVGGWLYITTIDTLAKHDSMLRAMFSGNLKLVTDSDGFVLIDRCGKHFGSILNFLRDGTLTIPDSKSEIGELLIEAKYYCMDTLKTTLETNIHENFNKSNEPEPLIQNKPFQTIEYLDWVTQMYADMTARKNKSPTIVLYLNKLLINTDIDTWENFDKNIEFFEELAQRYYKVISFIKFIYTEECIGKQVPSNEVCNWSFYNNKIRRNVLSTTLIKVKKNEPKINDERTVFPPNKEKIYVQLLKLLDQVLFEDEDERSD